MKIYIAGSWKGKERIKKEAENLKPNICLSKWLDLEQDDFDKNAELYAMIDMHGVMEADMLIFDSIEESTTGGKFVELGMALILNLQKKLGIVHIGPSRNLFDKLIRVRFEDWNEFYAKMGPALGIRPQGTILVPQMEARIGRA